MQNQHHKVSWKIKLISILYVAMLMFSLSTNTAYAIDLPCVPSDPQTTGEAYKNDVFNCVNKLYLYGLVISTIAAVFMIVLAGYLYIFSGGNEKRVGTAKSFISTSLVGLAVLVVGFLILQQINPEILDIKDISLGQIGQQKWYDMPINGIGSGGGGGGVVPVGGTGTPGSGSGQCTPVSSGPASVANLSQTCFGANATKASSIANIESRGSTDIGSGSDVCRDGNSVSWGLFQINISANTIAGLNCPRAFNKPFTSVEAALPKAQRNCYVLDTVEAKKLYADCVAAAKDVNNNIQKACEISKNGQKWGAWGANRKCKF